MPVNHLRILLDEVFGIDNFQSEIVWSYKRWSNSKKGLLNGHQNILFYSKTKNFKFNGIYIRRLNELIKTESALLKNGVGSYINKTEKELSILKAMMLLLSIEILV
jgi:site-specific DNA-methyltransferase (adenine-specific)